MSEKEIEKINFGIKSCVYGAEVARCINKFESFFPFNLEETSEIKSHHEQTSSNQQRFQKHVHIYLRTMAGSPFTEESQDLIVLESQDRIGHHVIETISNIKRTGKEKSPAFLNNRLISKEESLYDPIKQNNYSIFSTPKRQKRDSIKNKITI